MINLNNSIFYMKLLFKNTSYFLVLFCFLFISSNCLANCSKDYSRDLESKEASSGITSNLFGGKNSLSSVVTEVLNSGKKQLGNFKDSSCKYNCEGLSSSPILKVSVSPSKFLVDYKDKNKCKEFEQKTAKNKLKFLSPQFGGEDEFNDWFSSFVRGKGKEGQKLYKECSGLCSPRYEVYIIENKTQFTAKIEVICGEARDKSKGNYLVKSEAVWSCLKN